jgi:sugar lactone lactonase YvrE
MPNITRRIVFIFFIESQHDSDTGAVELRWIQNGVTVVGGNGSGNSLNQISYPSGLYVDDAQTVYVTECNNHRVVAWSFGATSGEVVAGVNGQGDGSDQLNCPIDVVVDKTRDCLIISDRGNRRVVCWPRQGGTNGKIIISNIDCNGLAIDNEGYLYVSNTVDNDVKRWRIGDTSGILVAGGNGRGDRLDQLNNPYYIFVDQDQSVYVSDKRNHRVMKWEKGQKQGVVVAGGHGQGNDVNQLSNPLGIIMDQSGGVYISDAENGRIIRWQEGDTEGKVIVGGNGKPNQLNRPNGLSFDRCGNLYVVEENNHRVQRFDIDPNSLS